MCRLFGYCSRGSASAASLLTEQGLRDFTALSAFHSDGWGMAWYTADGPKMRKSTRRAADEPDYDQLAHRRLGDIGLVHLRLATPGGSPAWDLHAGPGAVVAKEGNGERRNADMFYVPDGVPGFGGHARRCDVVGNDPEGQEVRDALVSGKAAAQLLAGFDVAEFAERRRRAVLMRRRRAVLMRRHGAVLMRRWLWVATAAHSKRRCDRDQQRLQEANPHQDIIAALVAPGIWRSFTALPG
jgi:hypothetical protein